MQQSPWAGAFQGFEDWDEDRKKQVVQQFVEALVPGVQDPKVVSSGEQCQLRGTHAGYPTRVTVDCGFYGGRVAAEMKARNAQPTGVTVQFDPESLPSADDDEDGWDDDDEVRVFLAKHVYVEGDSDDVKEHLAFLQALPADFTERLYGLMQSHRIATLNLLPAGTEAYLSGGLQAMSDPTQHVLDVLSLLADAAKELAALPALELGDEDELAGREHAKCAYCRSVYVLTMQSACPNCGAPFSGETV